MCVSGTCLHCGLNLHTGKRQLRPSAWAETSGLQGTGLGSGSQAGGRPGPEHQGEVATLLTCTTLPFEELAGFLLGFFFFFGWVSVCLLEVFLFVSFACYLRSMFLNATYALYVGLWYDTFFDVLFHSRNNPKHGNSRVDFGIIKRLKSNCSSIVKYSRGKNVYWK